MLLSRAAILFTTRTATDGGWCCCSCCYDRKTVSIPVVSLGIVDENAMILVHERIFGNDLEVDFGVIDMLNM